MYAPKPWASGIWHLCGKFPVVILVVVAICLIGTSSLWQTGGKVGFCGSCGLVSIVFDDGAKSVIEKAFPLMEKYGYKGTAYVITCKVGQPGYMTWEDLEFLQDHGWEIGSHSATHPYLPTLTDSQIHDELYGSWQMLQEHGFPAKDFALPYGEYDSRVLAEAKRVYESCRTSWPNGLNDIPLSSPEDRYLLKAVAADEITLEEVEQWIVRARTEHKWLILLFHRIDEGGDYSYTSADFETILRFLSEESFRQFLPDLILSQSFSCQPVVSATAVWMDLSVYSSVEIKGDKTSLFFLFDWQGQADMVVKKVRALVYSEDGKREVKSRTVKNFVLHPGRNCLEFLVRKLETGSYKLNLVLTDRNGKEWTVCFNFTIAPCSDCGE